MSIKLQSDWRYCEDILTQVSRTFALNIIQLKSDTYRAVLLGYLFFRIADTFEDTVFLNEEDKLQALNDFAGIFRQNKDLDERCALYEPLINIWSEDSSEKDLIHNGARVLRAYFDMPSCYRPILDSFIVETLEGMAWFQKRKLENETRVFQLDDMSDLEKYCYYVAGVVGKMLTSIFCKIEAIEPLRKDLEQFQIHFGLALQVTNIIKDYSKDISRGWCYIPCSITCKYDIDITRMDKLSVKQKKGIFKELLSYIIRYFDSALSYISLLPESERSIRMFCIIPFVLAYNTVLHIARMKGSKISRQDVLRIMEECNIYAISNEKLENNYNGFLKHIEKSML